jgi:hypothetical protein
MNPSKFCCEIEAEQCKHPGKCIYHLSKFHTTAVVLSRRKSVIYYDVFEDAVAEDTVDDSTTDVSNDTNEEDLIYFARMTNHCFW